MAHEVPDPPGPSKLTPSALSFLAPAALVLLPALALAFAPGEKDEAYEWTQHRVAGLGFAAAFASVLLGGVWRKGWLTSLGALLVGAALLGVTVRGLPGFDVMFALAGGMVAFGFRRASRAVPLVEVAAIGFGSTLCFWRPRGFPGGSPSRSRWRRGPTASSSSPSPRCWSGAWAGWPAAEKFRRSGAG